MLAAMRAAPSMPISPMLETSTQKAAGIGTIVMGPEPVHVAPLAVIGPVIIKRLNRIKPKYLREIWLVFMR